MSLRLSVSVLVSVFGSIFAGPADARSLGPASQTSLSVIVDSSPTLAPFQHVRFCMHYPTDCKSNSAQDQRIELDNETTLLLERVNRDVNLSIAPRVKNYGDNLEDGWKIAPYEGDCNDYAVTKRHELLAKGLPSSALRLSVIKTASGLGHLVLIVATTKGDIVLDNLTETLRPWQMTNYQWLKIQSSSDPRFWNEIKSGANGAMLSQIDRKLRLAGR